MDSTRQRVEEIAELGLTNLLDAWANVIADRFVRDARFDPLSIAATDQQLYNQLYEWLRNPARPREFSIDIEQGGSPRRAELNSDALIDKALPRYRMLDRHAESATIFLSHRAARLPGLADHLCLTAARVVSLDRTRSVPRSCITSSFDSLGSAGTAAGDAVCRSLPLISLEREAPAPTTHCAACLSAPPMSCSAATRWRSGRTCILGRDGFPDLPADFPRDAAQIVSLGAGVQLKLKDGIARNCRRRRGVERRDTRERCVARSGGCAISADSNAVSAMRPRRQINVFSMSFLDVMSCGFGAIVLLYIMMIHVTEPAVKKVKQEQLSEIRKLDFEVTDRTSQSDPAQPGHRRNAAAPRRSRRADV